MCLSKINERTLGEEKIMTKYIGTIIDKSYFEPYWVKETNNIHLYKICIICLEPIYLGFQKDENGGFACTLPHICDKFKEFNEMLILTETHTQLDLKKFIPELEWGQFIFINKKKTNAPQEPKN